MIVFGSKDQVQTPNTARHAAGATDRLSRLTTTPGQEAQVAFAASAESPWSPQPCFFPLKTLFRLCSVTNSITNVTQFVWQDVNFLFFIFLLTLLFLVTTLSQAFSDSLSAPAGPAAQLDTWLSPQLFPLPPALLSPANHTPFAFLQHFDTSRVSLK